MSIAIVDYGSGNLRSVEKALQRVVDEANSVEKVFITRDAALVAKADRIVLPGVGAFADCQSGLFSLDGMVDALREAVQMRGQPFLGICVGMQLLANRGLEYGSTPGLSWISGDVVRITPADKSLKVPHMGWNQLVFKENSHPVLEGLPESAHVYFVHSFALRCHISSDVIASVNYGNNITAVVGRDNVIGTQFHPEKSQMNGIKILSNFIKWTP
ncbi:MAG: imidazole glycerol phosphate synthase subunit HisH [Magnetovibrio sp.]|nr:imidazole glycerol phosphate synthase subunit HisH [Magnetovibrio sp.]|tara:strand:- start:309 stop:953 length:645 start_codon:yes stop_codon:yes gene_type:complete